MSNKTAGIVPVSPEVASNVATLTDGAIITLRDVSWEVDVPNHPPGTSGGKKIIDSVLGRTPMLTKKILNNITGSFLPGQVTALVGPSGAGKSTLLDVVSQRKTTGRTTGEVLINKEAPSKTRAFKRLVGYVEQDDVLPDTLTVKETIRFAAELKLKKTPEELDSLVEELILDLDLTSCANTVIGSRLTRGISGGQAKRVNIALQLVVDPQVLFLDEPTTGLDSLTALNLVILLEKLAHSRGRTIVLTIHSPSEDIYNKIDNVVLLATGGRLAYWGPREKSIEYLQNASGLTVPEGMNPADWLLQVLKDSNENEKTIVGEVEMGELTTKKAGEAMAAGNNLTKVWSSSDQAKENEKTIANVMALENLHPAFDPSESRYAHNVVVEFLILWRRTITMSLRNPQFIATRVGRNVFMGILLGTVFWNLGSDQLGLRDTVSVVFFLALHALFAIMEVLPILIENQVLVRVESAGSSYRKGSFLNVVVLLETLFAAFGMFTLMAFVFPMVGTLGDSFVEYLSYSALLVVTALSSVTMATTFSVIFTNMDTALAVAPVALILMMLLNGFLLSVENIPAGYKIIHYFSPAKYSFEILMKTTFENTTEWMCTADQLVCLPATGTEVVECLCPVTTGARELQLFGYEDVVTWEWILVLVGHFVGFYLLTLVIMTFRNPVKR